MLLFVFLFNDTSSTEIYTLSLHDALPISAQPTICRRTPFPRKGGQRETTTVPARVVRGTTVNARHPRKRSEEHTSELQSQSNLVCRLLLEKKNCFRCYLALLASPCHNHLC